MKKKAIVNFVIKLLRAVIYILSAGRICSCGKSKDVSAPNQDEGK